MRGCLARLSGGALLLLVFGLLAILIWRDSPASPAALEQPDAAKRYAAAWVDGSLDGEDYDPSSGPDVGKADPRRIAENVTWMVGNISPDHQNRPTSVQLVGAPRTVTAAEGEWLSGDQIQAMRVTWDLGRGASWTYTSEVVVRTTDGRQRVMWRPTAVHPALTHGLVLLARRLRSERAPVLYATGTELRADRVAMPDAAKKLEPPASASALIGRASQNVPRPAISSVNRIASVAYATDETLSLENTASACVRPSRSPASSCVASGRPRARRRTRVMPRLTVSRGSMAAARAVRTPGSPIRKLRDPRWGTRARRSPGRRP